MIAKAVKKRKLARNLVVDAAILCGGCSTFNSTGIFCFQVLENFNVYKKNSQTELTTLNLRSVYRNRKIQFDEDIQWQFSINLVDCCNAATSSSHLKQTAVFEIFCSSCPD